MNYMVNPPYSGDRIKEEVYDRVNIQIQKWIPVESNAEAVCGNVRPDFNTITKKFEFIDYSLEKPETHVAMFHVISSSLLLYRLLCLFRCTVESLGPQGYKCIWWISLLHKETETRLMLGEWKGAAGIWTKYRRLTELPEKFKDDILLLLNELVAKDCPHPYDGCVAGSVAQ